ncbi:hypothetical protein PsorP6_013474 [Peronosclerospora sorghi]|uniref:Uncharacterized protein n=1 Tax=Peronosclerospora sorghi TaxID=230839 RepID=A0ACC0VKQ9_9STRA|nr:hypothetical protein PsorP6_013474 [Peronosclerospora sorghi]
MRNSYHANEYNGVPTTSISRASLTSWSSDKSAFGSTSGTTNLLIDQKAAEAQHLLLKSAARIGRAKSKVASKGNARRVKDQWEEIRNFPPPMQYKSGSVPWKRLLTNGAQRNPKEIRLYDPVTQKCARWGTNCFGHVPNGRGAQVCDAHDVGWVYGVSDPPTRRATRYSSACPHEKSLVGQVGG